MHLHPQLRYFCRGARNFCFREFDPLHQPFSDHIHGEYADGFFKAGLACECAGEPVLPKCAHALRYRYFFERGGRHFFQYGLAERFVYN